MSLPQEPYTRIERYLAKFAGQDVDIPDKPITRIECYLDYIVNNGGGGGGYTPSPNAGAHNGVFRGQSLGDEFTSAQSAAITGGSFDDMYLGDYWTINGTVYRIAGFDIFLHMGDVEDMTSHHAVIVTDANMYDAQMNTEATTTGGYLGSLMKTANLAQAVTTIKADFGDSHIINRRSLFCSAVTNGVPSGWTWAATEADLMTEGQLIGRGAWGTHSQNGYNIGEKYSQFPLFSLAPGFISNRTWFWLQDVRNASGFSGINAYGAANAINPTDSRGVRPYFLIA